MANFKTCFNGHNYDATKYAACPFCPSTSATADYERTVTDFKKTEAFDDGNQFVKTMINEETIDLKKTPSGVSPSPHPFSRTTIVVSDANASPLQQSERRKLAGWLVTFSNHDYGEDYKVFAGKNKIGSASGCDIVINDASVSGEHATILFRENDFLIKDNFSTNGTRINGIMIEEGKLKDGDEIKLGNTLLKFKTVF